MYTNYYDHVYKNSGKNSTIGILVKNDTAVYESDEL